MESAQRDRWLQLAELASKEQDPVKMLALIEEINHILEEKEKRLQSARNNPTTQA